MIELNIENREICCGCSACAESCPVGCITMERDKLGFLYPSIDSSRCIRCGVCERVCPGLQELPPRNTDLPQAYAAAEDGSGIRPFSSSGGLFGVLGEYVVSQGGVVFGAAFEEGFRSVSHIGAASAQTLPRLWGAKYAQSHIRRTYQEARACLEQGQMVLFSGTPCQIAGIRAFLGRDYENLFLLDIVCHGVPAPYVWDDYLGHIEQKYRGKAVKVSFRDKRRGWQDYVLAVSFDNGREYTNGRGDDLYMRGFLHNQYLRPSCYACRHKSMAFGGDITLGDLWGAEKLCPELHDNKGTSLVLLRSAKGRLLFDRILPYIKYRPVDIQEAVKCNPAIVSSTQSNPKSAVFEREFRGQPVYRLLKKHCSRPLYKRCLHGIKRLVKGR